MLSDAAAGSRSRAAPLVQALTWRMHSSCSIRSVPTRSRGSSDGSALPGPSEPMAELAVRIRRRHSNSGEVASVLVDGRIIRTSRPRSDLPDDAREAQVPRAAVREPDVGAAELQRRYGLAASDWPDLREAVRVALEDRPLTRSELCAAVTSRPAFRHLEPALSDPSWTLLKPIAWQGVTGLGSSAGRRGYFSTPRGQSPLGGRARPRRGWDVGNRGVPTGVRAGNARPHEPLAWRSTGSGARRVRGWVADSRSPCRSRHSR